MEIRKVKIQDIENLKEIEKRTFVQTYSSLNNEVDMTKYLDNKFSTKELQTELNDKNSEFYFSEIDKKIIGYLKVNTEQSQTDIKDKNGFEIERIYVLKEFHRKKNQTQPVRKSYKTSQREKYIGKAKNGLRAKLMRSNIKMYGTPLSITSNTLKYNFGKLEQLIQTEFKQNKNVD